MVEILRQHLLDVSARYNKEKDKVMACGQIAEKLVLTNKQLEDRKNESLQDKAEIEALRKKNHDSERKLATYEQIQSLLSEARREIAHREEVISDYKTEIDGLRSQSAEAKTLQVEVGHLKRLTERYKADSMARSEQLMESKSRIKELQDQVDRARPSSPPHVFTFSTGVQHDTPVQPVYIDEPVMVTRTTQTVVVIDEPARASVQERVVATYDVSAQTKPLPVERPAVTAAPTVDDEMQTASRPVTASRPATAASRPGTAISTNMDQESIRIQTAEPTVGRWTPVAPRGPPPHTEAVQLVLTAAPVTLEWLGAMLAIYLPERTLVFPCEGGRYRVSIIISVSEMTRVCDDGVAGLPIALLNIEGNRTWKGVAHVPLDVESGECGADQLSMVFRVHQLGAG